MQLTFKQLEAFVAVYDQGTFDGAARYLELAQSAISRQIQELEDWFGFSLFDRTGRTAKPNTVAREVIDQIRTVLLQRDVFDSCLTGSEVVTRKLRLGITEFTALTWLPGLVKAISAHYPRMMMEPVVDASVNLKMQLMAGRLDIVILPDAFAHEGMVKVELERIPNSLYCAPGMMTKTDNLTMESVKDLAWLLESRNSGSGLILGEWIALHLGRPASQLNCNSLVALVGLALSGLGAAFLPDVIAARHVTAGNLQRLDITPSPPAIPYIALARADSLTPAIRRIMTVISHSCAGTGNPSGEVEARN